MSHGKRVLDQTYLFNGVHYCPGPGGYGVVDKDGNEIDLPKNFPEDKLKNASKRIETMEAIPFRGLNRVPTEDSERADGHAGAEPQDSALANPSDEDEGGEGGGGEGEDYDTMTVEELASEADSRGVEVKGTGSGGKVLKRDYVKALKKADKE